MTGPSLLLVQPCHMAFELALFVSFDVLIYLTLLAAHFPNFSFFFLNISGLDPKSIVINLATIFLIVLPFLAYFDRENGIKYCQYVAGSMVLAFLVPPVGWMRPHPYTDKPGNTPIGYKAQ